MLSFFVKKSHAVYRRNKRGSIIHFAVPASGTAYFASHTANELHGRGISNIFNLKKAEFGCPAFRAGDGGSRTRVRKPIHATFSGCRRSIVFPASSAVRQALQVGSLLLHDRYISNSLFTSATHVMPRSMWTLSRIGTLRSRGSLRTDSRP